MGGVSLQIPLNHPPSFTQWWEPQVSIAVELLANTLHSSCTLPSPILYMGNSCLFNLTKSKQEETPGS